MSRVATFDLSRFTGGLNLRANSQQLMPDESPFLLNVDVDPAGGVVSRNGFEDWKEPVVAQWDPRTLHVHLMSDGTEAVFLANDGDVLVQQGGGNFAQLAGPVADADPHDASFASWNDDVYLACGRTQASYRWTEAGGVQVLSDPVVSGWAPSATSPQVNHMPKAEHVEAHKGYLFAGNCSDGADRLRVSQFNDPDSWEEDHYIDFPEAGGPITGLAAYGNHLLVFFPNQVWAVYGYSPASFQRERVADSVGAVNAQCIAKSEVSVFFVSWPDGVFEVTGESVREVSTRLRPALSSSNFGSDTNDMWLGWVDRKLWWTAPYNEASTPQGAESVFVFDPSIGEFGAWVLVRSGCGCGVGPVAMSEVRDGGLGVARSAESVLKLSERRDVASDLVAGTEFPFETVFRTPWVFGSGKTLKDRWKRPNLVLRRGDVPYEVQVDVFHDYEEGNAVRRRTVTVDGADGGFVWGQSNWGQASWGAGAQGSTIEKAGTLGTAEAVQLEFRGEVGKPWGLSNVTFKFVPRRVR